MMYQSKKDETVFAKVVEYDEKYKTSILEYTTGEKKGQTINVTTATLNRWWRKKSEEVVEQEIFNVSVTDERTGKTKEVSIDTTDFIEGVDDSAKTYDFNNQPKVYREMPAAVREIYMLDKDPYPTVEEVIDMLVSWGADVKAYAEWIKLLTGQRILFRRNKKVPKKACIEIRMKEDVQVEGYVTEYLPCKSALIANTPYAIKIKKLEDLETVVKSLLATK